MDQSLYAKFLGVMKLLTAAKVLSRGGVASLLLPSFADGGVGSTKVHQETYIIQRERR